jgi:hypothetical protein
MNNQKSKLMPKVKTEKAWFPKWLPEWANEPLTFAVNPDESLHGCAFKKKKPFKRR